MNYLSKKFKIKKNNIVYKNEKNTGHYTKKPTLLKFRPSKNLYIKNEQNIFKTLKWLTNV